MYLPIKNELIIASIILCESTFDIGRAKYNFQMNLQIFSLILK